jgi:hypothetical protein
MILKTEVSPKSFVPLLGGVMLDHFQIYGKEIGQPNLGYLCVFGVSIVLYLFSLVLILFVKKVK